MISKDQIKEKIISHITDADVIVDDFRGDGYHYEVTVVSSIFNELSKIKQHQLVYKALGNWVGNDIHALSLNTLKK